MLLIGGVSAVAIGRLAQMFSAGAFLAEYDTDFLAGVPRIPLIEDGLFGKGIGKYEKT